MSSRKLLVLALLAASCLAGADDGWVGFSGNPGTLGQEHPTIRMASERVDIYVGRKEGATYDCTFHFHNDGPACTVRMGFPDYNENEDQDPPKTVFKWFHSWVGGKPAETTRWVNKDSKSEEDKLWRVKNVKFGANADVTVRDRYQMIYDENEPIDGTHGVLAATYVLHTGATWKGSIGRCEIVVHFLPGALKGAPHVIPSQELEKVGWAKWHKHPNWVMWSHRVLPKVQGNTLTMVLTNLEPTNADDLRIYHGPYDKTVR